MFKPGQLVQSIKYGDHYMVVKAGPEYATAKPLTPKRWFSETMFIDMTASDWSETTTSPKLTPQHADGEE